MIRSCILAMLSVSLACPAPVLAQDSGSKRDRKTKSMASMRLANLPDSGIDWDHLPPPAAGDRGTAGANRMTTTLAALPPMQDEVVAARRPAPAPAPVQAAPLSSARSLDARFDLAVNNAPAGQVFMQLGLNSPYNILVPPDVAGNITVSLKQTTVPEALETLRELFGYDFRIASGNRVFIYPNTVQTRLFKINYLPGRRQGASDLRVSSTSVANISGPGGSSGGSGSSSQSSSSGGNSGSGGSSISRNVDTSSVRMTSDTDFWKEVQDSLDSLIGNQNGRSVTLNPGAGVIVVRGTPAELRQVGDYLRAIQVTIERQVMLEAKIIEVRLSQSSQSGVNWSLFRGVNSGNRAGIVNAAPGVTLTNNGVLTVPGATISPSAVVTDTLGKGFYGLAFQSANFAALLSFLETQGDVQVLSSPRIATLNNQKAVLKVGSDELFITNVTSTQTSTGNSTTSSPTLTLQPFFSGIALDVTPQIDENGTVMLHVHPTVSVVAEKEKTIDLGTLGSYKLPLASSTINETDSIVRVKDGQIVAIGGLMQQDSTSDRNGVPGLSDVPALGGLFRFKSQSSSKRELVILIKPTVITDNGQWPEAEVPANKLSSNP